MSIFSCAKETSLTPHRFIEWDLEQVQSLDTPKGYEKNETFSSSEGFLN